ncbi:MAG: transcriptional regulator with XRE-family HTH domain [Flammeovirgaceae bacterium]|jgi:transcriptional regulator with XRE-family HTH domain
MVKEENIKLIFGLKAKLLRQTAKLSLSELSKLTGISISYINEIEKGKKYPKANKISSLADSLGTSYDWLVSLKLDRKLAPLADLLKSNILSELPLDIFGLEPRHILELISGAPDKLNAFISTLIEISRHYNVSVENFYFSALRSYQQMYDNYFEELEKEADAVREEYWGGRVPTLEELIEVIQNKIGYEVDEETLANYEELKSFRYVLTDKEKPTKMLINKKLTNQQKAFIFSREIGYHSLGIDSERSYTYSWTNANSFEELLNNFKATYFAGALLIPQKELNADLKNMLNWSEWQPEKLVEMMEKYNASPEMFMHRLTSLLPRLGLNRLFYLRLNHNATDDKFRLSKELHLAGLHPPHATVSNAHYCRRWISIHVVRDLVELQKAGVYDKPVCGAQISNYIDSQKQYFCISLARTMNPTPDINCSLTIGFVVDDEFKQKVRFWNSPNVRIKLVNEACETCAVADCNERAVPPIGQAKASEKQRIENALSELMD